MTHRGDIPKYPHRLMRAMFNPPEFLVPLLHRAQLNERLEAAPERPVVVVQAPAGCGKSTLLTQWRKARELKGDRCVWLSVPQAGLDVADLTLALAWALHFAGVEIQNNLLLDEFEVDCLQSRHGLAMLLASLSLQADETAIFVDDFEHLRDPAALELFEGFAAGLPRKVRLIIASRDCLSSGLSRMLSRGLVETFHAETLIFSAQEALSLLCEDMSPEDAAILHRRTEGWPVAVQLAKMWLRQGHRGTVDLQDFRAETGALASYLLDQVLSTLPEPMRRFLQDTSVLERITPQLAEAVHEGTDAFYLLRQLPSLQPLIVTLDRPAQIYRLHPLLAECLQQQLKVNDGERYERLQRAAARSFAEQGNLPEAVRHALAARDHDLACRIMEEADLLEICTHVGTAEVNNCLKQLAEGDWRGHRRIWLCRIFLLLRQGQWRQATSEYRGLILAMPNESDDDALDRITVEALLATDRPTEAEAVYERLVSECAELGLGGLRVDRILLMLKVVGELQRGNLNLADQALRDLSATYSNPEAPGSATFLRLHAAHIQLARGEIDEARENLRRLGRIFRKIWGPDRSIATMAKVIQLQIEYEQDIVGSSDREIAQLAVTLQSTDAWFDFYAGLASVGAELAYRDGGFEKVRQFLDTMQSRAAHGSDDGTLGRFILALEADFLARSGHIVDARARMDRLGGPWPSFVTWREQMAAAGAIIRLNLASDDHSEAARVADAMRSQAQLLGLKLSACRASVALAIARHGGGDLVSAIGALKPALTAASPTRYIAPFLEYRSEIATLLCDPDAATILVEALTEEEKAFVRMLRASLTDSDVGNGSLHRLSDRERQILILLCQEKSNKHIARAAAVGEDTVKYHLKNIYRKLGVASREEAKSIGSSLEGVPSS